MSQLEMVERDRSASENKIEIKLDQSLKPMNFENKQGDMNIFAEQYVEDILQQAQNEANLTILKPKIGAPESNKSVGRVQ